MIEVLPCGCCKTKPLKANYLHIRNHLLKGNAVFFDSPICSCCATKHPEQAYAGQIFFHDGLVRGDIVFPLEEKVVDVNWDMNELKLELNALIFDKCEFSYTKANISRDVKNNYTVECIGW